MVMLRGLSCVVTAYFVYTVLNLVTVAIAMDRMQENREALQRNVQALKEVNRRLQDEFDELSTSADLIRLYARGIGLYMPGERVIRLQGVEELDPFYEAGYVVLQLRSPRSHRMLFLLIGIATGGLLYARLRFRDRSRSDRHSTESPENHVDLLSNTSSWRVGDRSL
jgi:cell division protein FtsB